MLFLPLSKTVILKARNVVICLCTALLLLQTVASLPLESPMVQAGDVVVSNSTIFYNSIEYSPGSPDQAPLVPLHTPFVVYIDITNSASTPTALDNLVIRNDISGFDPGIVCTFVTGISGQNHLVLDFDGLGSSCTINTGNNYIFEGGSFPTSLAAGDSIYIRLTNVALATSSVLSYVNVWGNYGATVYGPIFDYYYVMAGTSVVSGYVFRDLNNDGLENGADGRYIGLPVDIYGFYPAGDHLYETFTDDYGYFYFTDVDHPNVTPGDNYRVVVYPDNLNEIITTNNNPQLIMTLANGATTMPDMGVYARPYTTLGDRVWVDEDHDGVQDGVEVGGISDVSVSAYQNIKDENGVNSQFLLSGDVTDNFGEYDLLVLPQLPCRGGITAFATSTADVPNQKFCEVSAGGEYYVTFRTDNFCVADSSGIRLLGADGAVLYQGGCGARAISNTLANNTVYYIGPFAENASGEAILEATESYTDGSFFDVTWIYTGDVSFEFYIEFANVPATYEATLSDQGSDDTVDSDINTSVPAPYTQTTIYNLVDQGDVDHSIDLGFYEQSSDPDLVLTKIASNSFPESDSEITYTVTVQNDGGVTAEAVVVTDVLPESVVWVSDDSSGAYDPLSGIWTVGDLAPAASASLAITVQVTGTDAIANTATGSTITAESNVSDNADTVNVFPYTLSSIGNYVWVDADEDGVQDNDEEGAEGITVELRAVPKDILIDTQITDADGLYLFTNLASGDYRVVFTPPENAHFTTQNAGIDVAVDSDADESTGSTDTISLAVTTTLLTIDAGIVYDEPAQGRILFHLFTDTNGNGVQDDGESDGASGTTIVISHEENGSEEEVETDENGDIDSQIAASAFPYTLTIVPPSGRTITGGAHPITDIYVVEDETTDIGSRGVYRAQSSSSGGGGGGGGGSHSGGSSSSDGSWVRGNRPGSSHSSRRSSNSVVAKTSKQDPLSCISLNAMPALSFPDVANTSAEQNVAFLTSISSTQGGQRVIQGYGNGLFGTEQQLTRFELTKIALKANCLATGTALYTNTVFPDVPTDNSEMSVIIGTAYRLGIVQGFEGKFYPNNPVTVGEMMKILIGSNAALRAAIQNTVFSTVPGVTENGFNAYAGYAVQFDMVKLEQGLFPQNKVVVRGQMAEILTNYIRYLKGVWLE